MFSSVFMDKMVGFVKNYFPVFMLGAVFGKVIELSGFSKSIVSAVIGLVGRERAMLSIVLVCAILTYGGVSLFVVVFAVYPFAAEMFRAERHSQAAHSLHDRARRIHLHDGRPAGHAADPEHHSDDVLQDDDLGRALARPDRQRLHPRLSGLPISRAAAAPRRRAGEGYGTKLRNEPEPFEAEKLPNPWIAISPLVVVGVVNFVLTQMVPRFYGPVHEFTLGGPASRSSPRSAPWRPSGRSRARCCSAF